MKLTCPCSDQSGRDVSIQVPINVLTHPAVSLSAACFGNNIYESEAARKCISNLIAVGYRRLHVDIYWSAESGRWGFCPVAIPRDVVGTTSSSSSEITSVLPGTLSTGTLTAIDPSETSSTSGAVESVSEGSNDDDSQDRRRQVPSTSSPATTPTPSVDVSTEEIPSGTKLHNIGRYSCSQDLDLTTLITTLINYFEHTTNTLDAHLLYVILNVHAAASPESPDDPAQAPAPDQLPTGSDSVAAHFDKLLGSSVYGPKQLNDDRADTDKWELVDPRFRPITEYFVSGKSTKQEHGISVGWPSEGIVAMVGSKRLLLGWENIDPQMSAYDLDGDSQVIFDSGLLSSKVDVVAKNESIQSGCLHKPRTTDVGSVLSSWATAELPSTNSSLQLSRLSREFSSCGISPILNTTLQNTTADTNIEPYRNVSLSSVWSWHAGEPRDSANVNNPAVNDTYLCAVMDLGLAGQWRSTDCENQLYAACRVENSPYKWVMSSNRGTYGDAANACPPQSRFEAPRTGLENHYLYSQLLNDPKSNFVNSANAPYDKHNVWIDFNSFDVPTCWISGGPEAQCPYDTSESHVERRTIVIPTIAAVVVLIVTALTIFVKCTANRRNSRRRRVIEGWEYEGVPS